MAYLLFGKLRGILNNRQMKVKLFNPVRDTSFPKQNLDAWVSKNYFNELGYTANYQTELFVEVKSTDPLNAFRFFLKLQELNQKTNSVSDFIFLSEDLKQSEWTLENGNDVSVTPISTKGLPIAEVVTVKLKEEEVANWSNEEEIFAINTYLAQNSISYQGQKVWIKPATKKTTLGVVADIKSTTKNPTNLPYLIKSNTRIVFLGLPEE